MSLVRFQPFLHKNRKMNIEKMRKIKTLLKEKFKNNNNIIGLGLGQNKLRVYLLKDDISIPTFFLDLEIDKIISGEIEANNESI